jgi:hypothetical protein
MSKYQNFLGATHSKDNNTLKKFLEHLEWLEQERGAEFAYECLKKSCRIVLNEPEEFVWMYEKDGCPPASNICGISTYFCGDVAKLYLDLNED